MLSVRSSSARLFQGPFARVFTRALLSDARSHFWYISDWYAISHISHLLMSAIIHAPPCYAAEEPWDALPQNTPCSIMASATRLKPAMLAPATRL